MKVLILQGKPGTGKTALGYHFASEVHGEVVYYLCHHWTTEEEMFVGIDIGAVAAGVSKKEDAYKHGVLLRAVRASLKGPVVLIVDELDKAPERMEVLLLDFLQTGRVHGVHGEIYEGNLDNLYVFITTNENRSLLEPTMRRGFRIRMDFLPPNVEADLLRKDTGASTGVIRCIVRMAQIIRSKGDTAVSLQEMKNLILDLPHAVNAGDVNTLILGWLVKEEGDLKALVDEFKSPAAVLFGEMKRYP